MPKDTSHSPSLKALAAVSILNLELHVYLSSLKYVFFSLGPPWLAESNFLDDGRAKNPSLCSKPHF